ncbi:unnamed protein product [Clonostachys chloroleuca]|uniref:Cellobiose dehydrogenase-like cytochrome domain-containing protein n=1 Tax=Clonostachys chloroleuca TaxID=1926264 RepID=A0AA35M8Y6_9HYPO|nr:unnamed protein product [Clonostachys chloroleuca]
MRPAAIIGVAASLYATGVNALASYTTGANDDIRLHWGFPNSTIKARTGNIYFKIDAPSTYAWVGIGVGKSMLDAMMFVVYKGTNDSVTVSMRTGEHHTPPVYTPTTKVQVLDGSGVADGRMVAEVKYADFNMEGKDVWMCAWDSVGPLELSDKKDAVIHKHDGNRQFTISHSAAAISSETSVFSASDNGSDNGIAPYVAPVNYDAIVLAHGIIMSALFLVLYPAGAIIMPLFGNWFYHAVEQCIAYLIMWVGFGLGVTYASYAGMFGKQTHTQMGTICVVLLSFQPVLGYLHHLDYKKHNRTGLLGRIHSWHGRGLMIVGIVNGGFGLQMTGQVGSAWFIAYVTIAVIVSAGYVGAIVYSMSSRMKQRNRPPRTVVVETVSGPALRLRSR